MLKRINGALNIVMESFTGVFIGFSAYRYYDYLKYPGLYASYSAPWYIGIEINALALFAVLFVCVMLKLAIRSRLKNKK